MRKELGAHLTLDTQTLFQKNSQMAFMKIFFRLSPIFLVKSTFYYGFRQKHQRALKLGKPLANILRSPLVWLFTILKVAFSFSQQLVGGKAIKESSFRGLKQTSVEAPSVVTDTSCSKLNQNAIMSCSRLLMTTIGNSMDERPKIDL